MNEVDENTELKNLLRRELSSNNKSKFSKFDIFSKISEVKFKEGFEIKDLNNIKTKLKKDIKGNFINNSSNEKDIKLSELLDITNSNKKSNKNNIENDNYIVQKEYIDNELSIKNTILKI